LVTLTGNEDATSNGVNPQTSDADEALTAVISYTQLNSRLPVNIDINIQIAEEETTRTVLRPDPNETIPPNVDKTVRGVIATRSKSVRIWAQKNIHICVD
jgi:hypothetical protein